MHETFGTAHQIERGGIQDIDDDSSGIVDLRIDVNP
jgi:hypothetical protein